jgi:hypothetical protein
MKKNKDPRLGGSLSDANSLHPFSNFRELPEAEWLTLRLAGTTAPRFNEPKFLRQARARIASAELASDHLIRAGLIPILDSFEFEAIQLKGRNK